MKNKLYFSPIAIGAGIMSIILFIAVPQKSIAQLSLLGPDNPGVVNEEFYGCLSCPGSEWIAPLAAMVPDSQYATSMLSPYPNCFMSACYYSRALVAKNFGFTIPAGSAIQGIRVEVLRKSNAPNAVHDSLVQLLRGGATSGGNRAAPAISFPVGAAYISYGDSTDLWDTTWTDAEINSTDFGIYFKPLNKTPGAVEAAVDHIMVTVYYLGPTGIPDQQSSTGGLHYDASTQLLFLPHNVSSNKNESSMLEVYDAKGTLVFEKSFSGDPPASVQTELRGSGIYIANFSDGKSMEKIKFFIPYE